MATLQVHEVIRRYALLADASPARAASVYADGLAISEQQRTRDVRSRRSQWWCVAASLNGTKRVDDRSDVNAYT